MRKGVRQGWLLLPFLFDMVFQALTRPVMLGKEIKGMEIGKEETKQLSRRYDSVYRKIKMSYQKIIRINKNLVIFLDIKSISKN